MIRLYLTKYDDLQAAKEKVLASYGAHKGEKYSIGYLPSGSPQLLADGKVKGYVSISHSCDLLAMAFSDETVGVDLERADREVSPKICKSIEEWTRIEAYAKYTGKGLSMEIIYGKIPQDIIHTQKWGEYVISVCSHDGTIDIAYLS